MKRWGLRGASVSHDKKHDTGANATQQPKPQCFYASCCALAVFYFFILIIILLNNNIIGSG